MVEDTDYIGPFSPFLISLNPDYIGPPPPTHKNNNNNNNKKLDCAKRESLL
jgi:hypothetical protein